MKQLYKKSRQRKSQKYLNKIFFSAESQSDSWSVVGVVIINNKRDDEVNNTSRDWFSVGHIKGEL